MVEMIYNPDEVGTEITNSKGKKVKIRKYHMTKEEMLVGQERWLKELSFFSPQKVKKLRKKSGKRFFNPFRKGIYYYQIQVLFLLGSNEWHSFSRILTSIRSYMSKIPVEDSRFDNAWDKFRGKSARLCASRCKDDQGRIKENFQFFQRLSQLHPYGYKLRQVGAAVDVKRVTRAGISNGVYFYRLSTYTNPDKAWPIRDYSRYKFPMHEKRYISYKFLGTIITMDKEIVQGVVK